MNLKFCQCRHCKRKRHSPFFQAKVKAAKHSLRSKTRIALRFGRYENLTTEVPLGYPG